ncbi:hypothetical protein B2J67_04345, partial [Vibrio cholerae]
MTFLTNLTFLGSSLDDAALADSFPILETLFAMGKKNITSPNIDDALISMGFDPKTRTASGLLELINGRYGPDIKEYLLKLNSSLSLN